MGHSDSARNSMVRAIRLVCEHISGGKFQIHLVRPQKAANT